MREKLQQYNFIILTIFLMAAVSVAGWAFASHYDIQMKKAGSQNKIKNETSTTNKMPSTLDHSKIILLLVCTGLVGFFGVRRQHNTIKTFVTENRSKVKLRINLSTENDIDGQSCQLGVPGCVAS